MGGLGTTSGSSPIPNLPAGSVAIGVVIEPLLAWLWAGGLLVGLGGVLALVPGSRRRATDPVSAPSGMVDRARPASRTRARARPADPTDGRLAELEPAGAARRRRAACPSRRGAPSA